MRKKLNLFSINPKKSSPFFVSRVAFQFAYEIPQTIRFIAYEVLDDVRVTKFEYKNSRKQMYKLDSIALSQQEMKKFIIFCGNIKHFVTYNNKKCIDFAPFNEIRKQRFELSKRGINDFEQTINSSKYDIISFLKDFDYENRGKVIRRRLKELK